MSSYDKRNFMFLDIKKQDKRNNNVQRRQKGRIIGASQIRMKPLPLIDNFCLVYGLKHNFLSIIQLSDNKYDVILTKTNV